MTRRNDSAICSRSQDFDFCAMHNGVSCIESLSAGDRGTARQYRFTAAMLAECFECKKDTIRSRVETLINTGDLVEAKNLAATRVPDSLGRMTQESILYDLDVFNKLAMTFLDNPRAVQIRCAFNDVLVKHETGTSSVPMDYEAALVELLAKVRENKRLEAERDEAIRSKYHFVEGRDAEMCGRVGGLRKANERLRTENGDSKNWKRVRAIKWLSFKGDMQGTGYCPTRH